MKLSVLQENLAKGLDVVGRAVSRRSTLPVLANIRLLTDGEGNLELAATNLEVAIRCRVGAKVDNGGGITLPANTLVDLVRSFPKERIDLELNAQTQTAKLVCGGVKANIKGIDHLEFPMLPEASETVAKIESVALREAINSVAIAAADNDARPVLTGVLFELQNNGLSLVATDGFRLALRSTPCVATPFRVVVPARALAEVARVFTDGDVNISMTHLNKMVMFSNDTVTVASQLIDGQFPSYEPVIPRSWNTRTIFDVLELRKAAKTSDIFARESANTVTLSVESDGATLKATSAETGDNTAKLDASVTGKPININFNVRYLMDALSGISTPQVAIETTAPNEPAVIKPVGNSDCLAILMPMQYGR